MIYINIFFILFIMFYIIYYRYKSFKKIDKVLIRYLFFNTLLAKINIQIIALIFIINMNKLWYWNAQFTLWNIKKLHYEYDN